MGTRGLSSEEIFRIFQRARDDEENPGNNDEVVLGGPPPPPEAESSSAQIRKEAVEEFKRSREFQDLVTAAVCQSFAEGFYSCKQWMGHQLDFLQFDLGRYHISTVPQEHRYLPKDLLFSFMDGLQSWAKLEL